MTGFNSSVGVSVQNPRFGFLFRAITILVLSTGVALGQSTFASLLGTVHDPSGGVLATCMIVVENTGTSARRSTVTDDSGSYTVPNLEPGTYKISIEAPGFQVSTRTFELQSRQTLRIDAQMAVASQSQTVNVTAESAPVLNTEVSNIAETKTGRELVDLPI